MARRRRKRKPMTITALFNRLAQGLGFFGVQVAQKRRATKKSYKALRKIYEAERKKQKEQGLTDLPTIAQAAKIIKQQEETAKQPARPEEIPVSFFADEIEGYDLYEQEQPSTQQFSTYVDEFKMMLNYATEEMKRMYGLVNSIIEPYIAFASQVEVTLDEVLKHITEEELGARIAKSPYYSHLMDAVLVSYEDALATIENIMDNLNAILLEVSPNETETTG